MLSCDTPVRVHERCRKKYTDKRELENPKRGNPEVQPVGPTKKLRSACDSFDFKRDCLYCGANAVKDTKNHGKDIWVPVRTLELRSSIMDVCNKRGNDEWSLRVSSRLHSIYLSICEIYVAPLQGNYSEALPAQARAKIKVLRSL